jgi:hypothetical protein
MQQVIISNKYKLIEKIGSGAFGDIYKGENIRTKESVAIKVEPLSNETKLLKNETKIYQYLGNTQGIPQVKWFGVDEHNNYMAMKLLGSSLTDNIKKEKKEITEKNIHWTISIVDVNALIKIVDIYFDQHPIITLEYFEIADETTLVASEEKINGVYNAVAPNPVTNFEMTKQIAKALNRPFFLPNVPAFILKLVFGEMSSVILMSQNISSKKIEEIGFKFKFTNLIDALRNIYK